MNIQALKTKIMTFAKKHGLELVVLFGSQATGKTHPRSDIDIGYIASHDFDFGKASDAQTELHDLFGREDVEFVNMRKVSPVLKKIISDQGVVLYEKHYGEFVRFKMYAFKLYVETKPLRQLRYRSLKNFVYGAN